MDVRQSWRLKRYGCLVPGSGATETVSWKVYEAKAKKPDIVLTIVESGYLMIFQGEESLTTVPLSRDSDHVKVNQKSDNLMLRFTMKGESRIIRMQFDGKRREEAQKACSSAMEKLMEYLPVTSHEDTPLPPNQTPAEVFAPVMQDSAVGDESEVVQGSLSLKELAQHFMGETAVSLPLMYCHSLLAQGDFETVVRACLLDPSFPAFVEKVEGELKKLLQE